MKKISRLIAVFFSFILLWTLASCSGSSKVDVDYTAKATATKITFNLTFAENTNLSSGAAVPHIKKYAYDETAKDHVGEYKSEDQKISFSNGVYTSASVTFSSLESGTKYAFRFYVTYNEDEELIDTWIVETKASGEDNVVAITSKDEFLDMEDDPEGYYELANDIDFGGDEISAIFTSSTSKQFSGSFDGKGHKLTNFKISSTNTALFGYTNKATIKNLVVEGTEETTTSDYSSGRSTANVGVLAGTATETVFENITITNASIKAKCNASATVTLGIVAGTADKCSFKNVHVENASIEYDYLRLTASTGLFAGVIKGDSVANGDTSYAVENCSATGTLTGTLYFPSSQGEVVVGGFVGDLGTTSLVKNSYVDATITLYKNESTTDANKFELNVGGFAGTNVSGSMNIDGCVAAADITVSSIAKGSETDASTVLLSNLIKNVNIGGFVGSTNKYIAGIKNSVYVAKTTGVTVNAKATNDESKAAYKKSNTVADSYEGMSTENFVCVNDTPFTGTLTEELQAIVAKYFK